MTQGPRAETALSVRGLRARGLEHVSFDLARGECLAVRGASGSGKTLLLRAIADLDPNDGELYVRGDARTTMSAPRWRRRVGFLATESGWWAERVGEHFADWSKAESAIAALGLPSDCRAWTVRRLSTGERQRLALARSLAVEPDVLLLDEPTSALDAEAATAVERLVADQLEQGWAALWVTHDDAQAERVAHRRLLVEHGHVREVAP